MNTEEEKFKSVTHIWTEGIEKTLLDIEKSCTGYKWMSIFAARKNQKKYDFLMYCSILFGPIAGILSASSNKESDYTTVINILVTIFSFLTGTVSAINKFSEFGDKALAYKSISSKYASLETNIKRQISLPKSDRVNPGEYLEWISSVYDDLFSSTPLITDDIYEEWLKFSTTTLQAEKHEQKVEVNVEKTVYDGKLKYELSRLSRMK